jgi:arylsulfatase A-like enzyme
MRLPVPLLLLVLAAVSACSERGDRGSRPERIILIVVDTLRRDHVSAYGSPVQTPNIDRLAAAGQRFENAVSAFHSTTMSMAALFTGRTPSIESGDRTRTLEWNTFASCGLARFAAAGGEDDCVPGSLDTLAEGLREAGYWTVGVVSNRLLFRPYGYDQGFDEWIEVGKTGGGEGPTAASLSARTRTARHVNRSVKAALQGRPSDRFFLYVHYVDVHDWILFRISYAESVIRFDRELGVLLEQLEAEGLFEDAVIVFTSDHGEMLVDRKLRFDVKRHYGNPSFEPLLRVPLLVVPGSRRDPSALVRSQDVMGLVNELAGIEGGPPPDLEADELLVTEQLFQTYRKGRWKSLWERTRPEMMLFDLERDPDETQDVSGSHPEVVEAHWKRVEALSASLAAPDAEARELDQEDLDRLQALGYLDAEGAGP